MLLYIDMVLKEQCELLPHHDFAKPINQWKILSEHSTIERVLWIQLNKNSLKFGKIK